MILLGSLDFLIKGFIKRLKEVTTLFLSLKNYIKKEMKNKLEKSIERDVRKTVLMPCLRSDLPTCIPWRAIEEAWGRREFKRFMKWMNGQTCLAEGAYDCDVERYARQRNNGNKNPTCFD